MADRSKLVLWIQELEQADKEAFAEGDWERCDRIRLSLDDAKVELRAIDQQGG